MTLSCVYFDVSIFSKMFVKNSIPFHLYYTLSYIDQQVDSSSKGVLAEIRKMQQSINNFVEPLGMTTPYIN